MQMYNRNRQTNYNWSLDYMIVEVVRQSDQSQEHNNNKYIMLVKLSVGTKVSGANK